MPLDAENIEWDDTPDTPGQQYIAPSLKNVIWDDKAGLSGPSPSSVKWDDEEGGAQPAIQKPTSALELAKIGGRGLVRGTLGIAEAAGTGMEWLGQRTGIEGMGMVETGRGLSESMAEKQKEYAGPKELEGKNVWDNPEILGSPSWWVSNVAEMVPSLASTILPGGAAYKAIQIGGKALAWTPKVVAGLAKLGAAIAGGAVGGEQEGASTYRQVLNAGGTEEEAARAGELMALGSAALNALSTGNILSQVGKGFKAKALNAGLGGLVEGITEGAEEPWEVASIVASKILTGQPMPENVGQMFTDSLKAALTVAPIAAVTGVGAGGAIHAPKGAGIVEGGPETTPPQPDQSQMAGMAKKLEADYHNGDVTIETIPEIVKQYPKDHPVHQAGQRIIKEWRQLQSELPIDLGQEPAKKKAAIQPGPPAEPFTDQQYDQITGQTRDQTIGAIMPPLAGKSALESAYTLGQGPAYLPQDMDRLDRVADLNQERVQSELMALREQRAYDAEHAQAALPWAGEELGAKLTEDEATSKIHGLGGLAPYLNSLLDQVKGGVPGRRQRVKDYDGTERWFGLKSTYPEFMRNKYTGENAQKAIEKGLSGYEFKENETEQKLIWEEAVADSQRLLTKDINEYAALIEEEPERIADVDDLTYQEILTGLRNEGYSTRAIQDIAERYRGPIQARAIKETARRLGIPEEEISRATSAGEINLDQIWNDATLTDTELGGYYDNQREGRLPRPIGEGQEPGRALPEAGAGGGEAGAGGILQTQGQEGQEKVGPKAVPDSILEKVAKHGPAFIAKLSYKDKGTLFEAGFQVPWDYDALLQEARARGLAPAETPTEGTPPGGPAPGLAQDIEKAAHEAATSPKNALPEPTPGQIEQGNYKKGHITLHGLNISIENPKGSTREGVDRAGKPWKRELKSHYGYIRKTEGEDGDHVDTFIGPHPESEKVFVIDQVDPKTGTFDEAKVMLGYPTEKQARVGYLANYERGWKGIGAITEYGIEDFKKALFSDEGLPVKVKEKAQVPAEAGKGKEPYLMGREEYFAEGKRGFELAKKGFTAPNASKYTTVAHRQAIKQALVSGALTSAQYNELHAKDYGPLEKFAPEVVKVSPPKAPPAPPIKPRVEEKAKGEGKVEEELAPVEKITPKTIEETEARVQGLSEIKSALSEKIGIHPHLEKGPRGDKWRELRDEIERLENLHSSKEWAALHERRRKEVLRKRLESEKTTPESLLPIITSLQRTGQPRSLVSISELRDSANMPYDEFDKALLQLSREGKVALHHHDFPASLSEAERKKLLSVENPNAHWGGRDYFVGVVPIEGTAKVEGKATVPGRYMWREYGKSSDIGTWEVFPHEVGAQNTQEGHDRLVSEWNKRDQGKRIWRWEPVQPGDIDHPEAAKSAPLPVAKEEAPTPKEAHGWVRIKNIKRPFTEFQEITRGTNKGKVRVIIKDRRFVVSREQVSQWPGEKAAADGFKQGDIISDGLVRGKVLGEGSVRMGSRKEVPAYKVEILTGHEKGKTSLIMKDEAKTVAPLAEKVEIKEPPTELPKATEGEEKPVEEGIQDFGEKIGGARKDYYAEFRDQIKDAKSVDLTAEPLSKSWPEPDYQKLIDAGTDPWMVAFVRAARDEVPTKPQTSWKLQRWVSQTQMLRGFAIDLLEGNIDKQKVQEALDKTEFQTIRNAVGGRADLYLAVGHEKSLKGLRIASGRYSVFEGKTYDPPRIFWSVEQKAKKTAFSNWPRQISMGETREEAIENFKDKYASYGEEKKGTGVKFDIYGKRGQDGIYVGKKIGRDYIDLEKFATSKEAVAYRKEHQVDLEEKLAQYKTIPNERRAINRERIGKDHRKGKDVTPGMFTDAFGFRGVEFGNWVPDKERQDNLNRAYDALTDLSLILNIPTKAISLNGELGLAFGARGIGGKMAPSAHYEPGKVVINLTRKNGPGTLAHEWWHALDSYFSRGRGQKEGYVSERAYKLHEDPTRIELLNAFKGVMDAVNETGLKVRSRELDKRRTKDYWGTDREMAARAFENYVIEKLAQTDSINDYLANIERPESYGLDMMLGLLDGGTVQEMYPYLLDSEIEKVAGAYDKLFETIETKETDKGITLFRPEDQALLSPNQLRNAAESTRYVYAFMKMAGASQEVLDRIKIEAGPFIDLRGKNYQDALDQWIRSGADPNNLFGAATIHNTHAVVQLATNLMNLNELELTAYHEWYHIAKRWLMTGKDSEAISKFFPAEEGKTGEAESFARFARTRRIEGVKGDVTALHRLWMKLRRYLQVIANGLKGKGWTTAEDIFGKLYMGAYEPHFRGAAGETALTMAGVKAAGRPTGLSNALEMLSQGASEEETRQKTGWQIGAEGLWRFEIDDSKAELTRNPAWMKRATVDEDKKYGTTGWTSPVKLSEVLDHPDLFKFYPQLKDVLVEVDPTIAGKAYYDEGRNTICISEERLNNREKTKISLFHEAQHAVQAIEGFARGGSPEEMYENIYAEERAKGTSESKIKELAGKKYWNLAAEIESRDTSTRIHYDAEMRKIIPPYSSENIPRSQWIVRDGTGAVTSFEVERPETFFRANPDEEVKSRAQAWIAKAMESPESEQAKAIKENEKYWDEKNVRQTAKEEGAKVIERVQKDMKEGKAWTVEERPNISWWAKMLGSPEFTFEKVPAAQRVFTASLDKVDDAHSNYNGFTDNDLHMGALRNFNKERPTEYKKLEDLIWEADRTQHRYSDDQLKSKGFSDQALDVWHSYRKMMDNALDALMADWKKVVDYCEANGLPLPEVVTHFGGKQIRIDLKVAMAQMGNMRGWYAPRVREPGRYQVTAKKSGENSIMQYYDLAYTANKRAKELEGEGYKLLRTEKGKIPKTAKTPEDVFLLAGKTMAMNDMINSAMQSLSRDREYKLDDFGLKGFMRSHGPGSREYIVAGPMNKEMNDVMKKLGGRFWPDKEHGGQKAWHFSMAPEDMEYRIARALSLTAGMPMASDSHLLFAHALATEMASLVRGRGFRSHMLQRKQLRIQQSETSGKFYVFDRGKRIGGPYKTHEEAAAAHEIGHEVWLGYETNLMSATSRYLVNLSNGLAKKNMMAKMVQAVSGTDILPQDFDSYEAYLDAVQDRRIDSKTQSETWDAVTTYMQEMSRNEEFSDRVIGFVKAIAVLKYLGLRLGSAAVNMTSLITSVPGAMHGYGKIPLMDSPRLLGKAMNLYRQYRWGDPASLRPDVRQAFDMIREKGWDEAQYTNEAIQVLKGKYGTAWDKLSRYGMMFFGATEKVNRISTIMGSYLGVKEQNPKMAFDDAITLAKKISDRAHGVYGKTTRPYLAQGSNPFAQMARMFYVFSKFSHNYLQTLYDVGFNKKDGVAAIYMMMAPAILAGGASIPLLGPTLMYAFSQLLAAFGDHRPEEGEERLYAWLSEKLGSLTGEFARFGVAGLAGVNIKSSIQIRAFENIPMTIPAMLGAPGSVAQDIYDGGKKIVGGQVYRGVEKLMPGAIRGGMQGVREYREGLRTEKNVPMVYRGKPITPSFSDTVLKALTFNPAGIAETREKRYADQKTVQKYQDQRGDIYTKIRSYYMTPAEKRDVEDYASIMEDIREYNEKIKANRLNTIPGISFITKESIKGALRRKQ